MEINRSFFWLYAVGFLYDQNQFLLPTDYMANTLSLLKNTMNEWMGVKRHIDIQSSFSVIKFYKNWSFAIVEEQWQNILIKSERRRRGRIRAEPSNPKRTKGYFRCRVSIETRAIQYKRNNRVSLKVTQSVPPII